MHLYSYTLWQAPGLALPIKEHSQLYLPKFCILHLSMPITQILKANYLTYLTSCILGFFWTYLFKFSTQNNARQTRVLKTSVENKRPKKNHENLSFTKKRIDQYIVLTYPDIYVPKYIYIYIYEAVANMNSDSISKKIHQFFVVYRNIESIIDWKLIFEMPY